MNDDFSHLWQLVTDQFHVQSYSVHGPSHWRRVERNGLLLATRTGADVAVVRLFALFHDSRREHDGWDRGHGARGAAFAASLRGTAFELSNRWVDPAVHPAIGRGEAWPLLIVTGCSSEDGGDMPRFE